VSDLIIDIETVAQDFGSFSESVQEYIRERCRDKRKKEDAEIDGKIAKFCALTPEFGKIVAVGLSHKDHNPIIMVNEEEERLLSFFWVMAPIIDRFITFNGWSFDLPYILKRSILTGVKSTTALPLKKYDIHRHFDVMQILANWGKSSFSLDIYSSVFLGKEQTGKGSDIAEWWEKKDYASIKKHCLKDIELTKGLYQKLAPYYLED